ncbi:hydrolase [Marinitenerispora sediminis]|uniref:Hydrolase n=1 Tax=Marinitenerispora sediminis TaxID=1931232 RepID=A0A368T773_9ACTN|nr:hydrolase [Marinitenerispora sediminis]RCV50918.1 hydrolase [Marinitenerispora sediminis]RCV59722.1 hydrolase [Marinitenerispora sediminis]RCV59826.1 hydrolase [Marinitenerispora sediminis]
MTTRTNPYIGLDALLTPENSVLVLIDHQGAQFAGMNSHDTTVVVNNVTALAKGARLFGVPTILTTVVEERGGRIIRQLQDVFPDQRPLDRTTINTWEDRRVVDAVAATGRRDLVMAALWTDICLAFPAVQALAEGYRVFAVTDASGAMTAEAHERGVQRMVQAGVVPTATGTVLCEWQRDWARQETVPGLNEIMLAHGASFGTSLAWEFQLLGQDG